MAMMEESNYQGRTVLQNWIQSKQQSWNMYKYLWYTKWVMNWFEEGEDLEDWTWKKDLQGYMLWRTSDERKVIVYWLLQSQNQRFLCHPSATTNYHSLDCQCILHIDSISKEIFIFSYYQLISSKWIMTFTTWKY